MARFFILIFLIVITTAAAVAAIFASALGSAAWLVLAAFCAVLLGVGIHDLLQTRHAILRNYPILGHFRFFFEFIRPELQQYFIERNTDGKL
ncbi:hypothetical protein [Glutamicibacter creatinolyticus]|uniref:hypothetical protein n=1 Tax=Glutamicibacter creatinolyticus TaxID=162496 RepID=UPI00337E72F3